MPSQSTRLRQQAGIIVPPGATKKPPGEKRQSISVTLDPPLLAFARQQAAADGLLHRGQPNVSAWLNQAVSEIAEREKQHTETG